MKIIIIKIDKYYRIEYYSNKDIDNSVCFVDTKIECMNKVNKVLDLLEEINE